MKKVSLLIAVVLMAALVFAGCGAAEGEQEQEAELTEIVVGASTTPHAEILAAAADLLQEKGYALRIVEFDDYVQPNLTLDSGELDANYFQHLPYLEDFNEENGTDLVSLAAIHYEPLGIYPGKTAGFEELKDGDQIAVPNDTTNEARALLLLETEGLLKVDPNAGLAATKKDIVENPKNLKIVEIEAAQLPRSLPDVNMAVINGNYAIKAGLSVSDDAIALEAKDSEAASTYANIVAIRAGDENREALLALAEVLQSETIRNFIDETYGGAVVPIF